MRQAAAVALQPHGTSLGALQESTPASQLRLARLLLESFGEFSGCGELFAKAGLPIFGPFQEEPLRS